MESYDICRDGHEKARKGSFETAFELLTKCLNISKLSDTEKAEVYKSRAWALYSLNKSSLAVQDQEAAFELVKPSKYNELINYASYLREVKRYKDSLSPLYEAVKLDDASGHVSMMTQYNIGWSLSETGKYNEAINAFTKAIPSQPDFPFVYWRRGKAYHALGMKAEAKTDFLNYAKLLKNSKMKVPPLWREEINNLLSQYNLK